MNKLINFVSAKFTLVDAIVVLVFWIFASLYQINRMAGNSSFLFYASDTASLAGFAAAIDHPELFAGDEVLANKKNFDFYSTAQTHLARFISRFTGDYATPFILLLWLHNFLMPLGFYVFGRVIFQSRYWGFLLASLNLAPVPLAITEFWGIYCDLLPRISFHVFLPYLLSAVFFWRFKIASFPWLLAITGFSMYIYPASVPTWGLSIWLGLWLFLPSSWKNLRKVSFMLFLGICFLLGALPYLVIYLRHHVHGYTQNYDAIYEIMNYRYPDELFNALYAFYGFLSNPAFLRILLFGLCGAFYVLIFHRTEVKKIIFVGMWIFGILITSVAIPLAEQLISRNYKIIPLETEMVRNSKFLFPLLLTFCLWPFVAINRDYRDKKKERIIFMAGLFLVFTWSSRQIYKHTVFLSENGYFLFNPNKTKTQEIIDTLNAIKRLTPPRSRFLVLASFPELSIRYYALRPLVYSYKDGAVFIYTNHSELIEWHKKAKLMEKLRTSLEQMQDDNVKMKMIYALSKKFNAQFVLIDCKSVSESFMVSNLNIIYRNNLYAFIRIDDNPKKEIS